MRPYISPEVAAKIQDYWYYPNALSPLRQQRARVAPPRHSFHRHQPRVSDTRRIQSHIETNAQPPGQLCGVREELIAESTRAVLAKAWKEGRFGGRPSLVFNR